MSDNESKQFTSPAGNDLPQPARDELDEPPLDAEDLEKEIGQSELWDPASHDDNRDKPVT